MDQEAVIVAARPKWAKEPGAEPIPGYRLLEPLGRGGFGEVWKCEAPGGLFKAVKFVPNEDDSAGAARQERAALQRIKSIRHPFIVSLDRVEVVDGVLVIVMELADKSLHSLLGEYQGGGRPGIPRDELLGYLLEAAEALDWMNFKYNLQHLDIKPHNLFLVSNHLKVADFGLVDRPSDVASSLPSARNGGVTPLYAAPEQLCGNVSRTCDQYSLAIVYQQLLTGALPIWHQNLYQLMLLHLSAEPNLTPLPPDDRRIVARALSKRPEDRFPSCLDFLQALICGPGGPSADLPRRASAVKKMLTTPPALEPANPDSASARAGYGDANAATPSPRAASAQTVLTNRESDVQTPPGGTLRSVPRPLAAAADRTQSGPSSLLAPVSVALPGYRFLQAIAQTPLGDVWKVEDEQGRARRALCLFPCGDRDPVLMERLQSLTHPALPPVEVKWSPAGRLVLVTEEYEQTLRDRLEACQRQGLPGIPREELLGHLRVVAEALDALYQQHNLSHLGLHPRALLLSGETAAIADFGLVPLLWLPTGQTGGHLNGRYAAPELFEKPDLTLVPPGEMARAAALGRASSASDQYSLALIYAELLNGLAPQFPRASGQKTRPGARRERRGDSTFFPVRGEPRVDLELLPACDRDILRQALADDPEHRFPSCAALVEALTSAVSHAARRADLYARLPPILPFATLQGEQPSARFLLPPLPQLLLGLALPNQASFVMPRTIVGARNVRYALQENDLWECKCPVQTFTGAVPLKIAGFQEEWDARMVHEKDDSFVFHIDLHLPPPPSERPSQRGKAPPNLAAFELEVQSAASSPKHFAEARMRIRPHSGDRERIGAALRELAPKLFDSMRRYLLAGPEQRSSDRWHCPQPLHVYPVRPDLEIEAILDGISRNISMTGVSFRVPAAPDAEFAYLHWHKSPEASLYVVLVRIVRVQAMPGGGFEVGASFSVADDGVTLATTASAAVGTEQTCPAPPERTSRAAH